MSTVSEIQINKTLYKIEDEQARKDLGGFSFYNNPSVVFFIESGTAYTDENDNYVLADSTTGQELLANADVYYSATIDGNYYTVGGADTVFPFKSKSVHLGIICLGEGTSFDVSNYDGYENFTLNNFIVCLSKVSTSNNDHGRASNVNIGTGTITVSPVINYDSSTGMLTISNFKASASRGISVNGSDYETTTITTTISSPKVYLVPSGVE